MKLNSKEIIDYLNLTPHPEGGYFKETYRSKQSIINSELWEGAKGSRNYSTGIYFMLENQQFSAFHKIRQDEMWHFYMGASILIHMINKEGEYKLITIGNKINKGEFFQYVIPANTWFASELKDKKGFSLCGCTVSPGFDFNDFEMPSRKFLIEKFPKQKKIISRLTKN